MTSFYLPSSSPWLIRDDKFGIEVRRSSGTLPLTFTHLTGIYQQPTISKASWERQRFGELFGGTYNVTEETERFFLKNYNRN